MLEVAKTLSFVVCILTLYHAAIHSFFIPGAHWRERLVFMLVRLAFAACVCYLSGMLFVWPSSANPDRNLTLTHTPPVRLYLWGMVCIAGLFVVGWFFSDLIQQCGPFITTRTLEKF